MQNLDLLLEIKGMQSTLKDCNCYKKDLFERNKSFFCGRRILLKESRATARIAAIAIITSVALIAATTITKSTKLKK